MSQIKCKRCKEEFPVKEMKKVFGFLVCIPCNKKIVESIQPKGINGEIRKER